MKNKILIHLFTAVGLLTSSFGYSQINPKFFGEPDEYKAMAKRTMVVELLEEDPDVIKKLSKKEKTAEQLKDYKESIADYNRMISAAVEKYWTYNEKIEYKTKSEIENLLEAKSTKYVMLAYAELGDREDRFENPFAYSDLTVPALIYHRTEEPVKKPDYKIYIPSSFVRNSGQYLDCDFKAALICMQNNIKWMIKNNKKNIAFNEYAEEIAKTNCSKLKTGTLLIDKEMLDKVSPAEAKSAYANIEIVTAEELNSASADSIKGKAILLSVPYGMLKMTYRDMQPGLSSNPHSFKGTFGEKHLASASLVYFKIIVDCESGEILWTNNPGNFHLERNHSFKITKSEIAKVKDCKM